jgi:membrane carboxypeptidase/penicillin-binding protein
VALAALERRHDGAPAYTHASVVEDEPLRVATRAGRWEPRNYDRTFRGPVTFRQAIEQSLNVPFARVGLEVGAKRIVETARRVGIRSPLNAVPSLALGSSEVTLLELTSAYGVFATGGSLAPPRTLLALRADGELRPVDDPRLEPVVDPAAAYLVTSALEGVVTRGTGRGLDAGDRWAGIAGKSGTSNEWRDAWFLAYTPDLVVGVWVGHDDGRSLRMTGSQAAIPIVGRFLREAGRVAPSRAFRMPDGIEVAHVGRSGSDWDGWECHGERELFLDGTAPQDQCEYEGFPEWRERLREWRGRPDGQWAHLDDVADVIEDRAEVWAERLIERARRLLER